MLLSPGFETKETSLQTTVVNSATGSAATVGKFNWGPAFEISQVISEIDLVDRFSIPDDQTAVSFFSAANFLRYGNDLRLVRVVDAEKAKNSSVLNDMITGTLTTDSATNYSVGDTIEVKYPTTTGGESSVVAVGTVIEIDQTSGKPTKFYIPSEKIVEIAKEKGEYPELTNFTAEFKSSGGGTNATITALKVITDSGIYFPNDDSAYDSITATGEDKFSTLVNSYLLPSICARFPGEFGNGIEVHIASYKDWQYDPKGGVHVDGEAVKPKPEGVVNLHKFPYGGTSKVNFRSYFAYGPANENQFAMIVRKGDEVLETAILSTKKGDTDIYNNNIFMDDYFSIGRSRYLSGVSNNWPKNFSGILVLGGGTSAHGDVNAAEYMLGWDMFSDRQQTPINLLIAGSCASDGAAIASTVQKHVNDIATARQDCLAFISPPKELMVGLPVSAAIDNLIEWRQGRKISDGSTVENNMNINSTYSTIDGNYKFQYDKYNDVNRWIPLAADIAGLCARTDQVSHPWMSPAGFNRGQIQGVIKLAVDTRQAHRDRLYQDAINPIVSFAGQGILMYGDKTATSQPTPFDRINVRRLFNMLKINIGETSQYKLFELNDAFTQMSFRSEVNGYMDGIKSLGGVYDFLVVCDGTNNTPAVIDRNEFIATILIKPARSINFITLNFVATSTGADFAEIVG